MRLYRIEHLNVDGNIQCVGYFINKENAEEVALKMNEWPVHKKYGIIQQIIEIDTED